MLNTEGNVDSETRNQIYSHLAGISRFSYLLAKDVQLEWTETMLEGIIGYFYERILKEQNIELNMQKAVEDIQREIFEHQEEIIKPGAGPQNPKPSNHGISEDDWADFLCLCTIKKDGAALEQVFEDSIGGKHSLTVGLAVKYERILRIIRENRTDMIPPEQYRHFINLDRFGYIPYRNNVDRSRILQPPSSSSPHLNGTRSNERKEESYTPSKRGRKKHDKSSSHSFNNKRQKRSPEDEIWWRNIDKLVQYHADNGTYNVPEDEVILDDDDETTIELGKWLKSEKEKYPNYMAFDGEKYEVLADLACNGLWTAEEETTSTKRAQGTPTRRRIERPTSSTAETAIPSAPAVSIAASEPKSPATLPETSSTSVPKPVIESSSLPSEAPAKKNLTRVFPTRKSNEPSRVRSNSSYPTYPTAEPKNIVHLGKRQEKQIDPRQNSKFSNSIMAEPKRGAGAFDDSSDEEVQFDIHQKYPSQKSSSNSGFDVESKVIYRYGDQFQYIGVGEIETTKKDRNTPNAQSTYIIVRILPKSPKDGVESEFLYSKEYHEVEFNNILHGDITISKRKPHLYHLHSSVEGTNLYATMTSLVTNRLTEPSKNQVVSAIARYSLHFES